MLQESSFLICWVKELGQFKPSKNETSHIWTLAVPSVDRLTTQPGRPFINYMVEDIRNKELRMD